MNILPDWASTFFNKAFCPFCRRHTQKRWVSGIGLRKDSKGKWRCCFEITCMCEQQTLLVVESREVRENDIENLRVALSQLEPGS